MVRVQVILPVIFLVISSCISTSFSYHVENPELCTVEKITAEYFSDYNRSVECSRMLSANPSNDPYLNQIANFISGEHFYHSAEGDNAFENLMASASGPDCNIALASLEHIRKMHLSYENISRISRLSTSSLKDQACRGIIDYERKGWSLVGGDFRYASRIGRDLNYLNNVEISRSGMRNETSEPVFITIPSNQRYLVLSDFYNEIDHSTFRLKYKFSFQNEKEAPVIINSDLSYRMFINGKLVHVRSKSEREGVTFDIAGNFKFHRGDYTLEIETTSQITENSFISVFIPDYNRKEPFYADKMSGNPGNFGFLLTEPPDDSSTFDKYLEISASVVFKGSLSEDAIVEFYSSILGLKNPPILYKIAETAFLNGNTARAENILKYVITEHPSYYRALLKLMKILLDSSRLDELDELISSVPGELKNRLAYKLFLSDYYAFRGLFAKNLRFSKEVYSNFRDYPSASIYFASALEDFGAVEQSNTIRFEVLRYLPYYFSVLERARELAEITGQLDVEISLLKKYFDINVFDKIAGVSLGKAYMKKLDLNKAETVFKNVLNNDRQNVSSLLALGDIAALRNDGSSAEKYYRLAYDSDPGDKRVLSRLVAIFDSDFRMFFRNYAETDEDVHKRVVNSVSLMPDRPYEIVFDEGIQKIVNRKLIKGYFRLAIRLNNIEGIRLFSEIVKDGTVTNVRIIKKDGTISKNIRNELNSLIFYDLAPGDTIDYTYTITQENDTWLDAYNSVWHFGQFGTVSRYSRLSVLVPDDIPVNFFVLGDVEKQEVEVDQKSRMHIFKTENVFLPPKEKMMPRDTLSVVPNVQMSSVASWEDFAKWQSSFIKESSVVTNDMISFVKNVTETGASPMGIVATLRDFAARNISYSFADSGIYLVKPERSDITFNRKSGDCKDKALLLKVLLRIAGIKSHYVLVKSHLAGDFRIELPYMQFDHAIVYIPEQDGIEKGFFVDPTSSYDYFLAINPQVEGSTAMVIDHIQNSFEFVEVRSDIVNTISVRSSGEGRFQFILTGGAASTFRFKFYSGESPSDIAGDMLINKFGVSPGSLTVDVPESVFVEPLIIEVVTESFFPAVATGHFGEIINITERNYPIHFPPGTLSYKFAIQLDPEDEKEYDFEMETRFFSYSMKRFDDNTIKIVFIVKMDKIRPEEFVELRKNVMKIIDFEKRMLSELAW